MLLVPNVSAIIKRRNELGLSRRAASLKAGLPKNAIGRIESGESKKTHNLRAKEIAKALNCKVEDLFDEVS